MPLLHKPTPVELRKFLEEQAECDFTYDAVGQTQELPPANYRLNHTRQLLGQGEPVFTAARTALENWQQLHLGWLDVWPDDTPIVEGSVVAIIAQTYGFWWLNACRIVYVCDESNPRRFGFAYGTLPGHIGSGEERFLIEMDQDGKVWYDIFAFSQPRYLLARIGYPYLRYIQKLFGKQSAAEMQAAVPAVDVQSSC